MDSSATNSAPDIRCHDGVVWHLLASILVRTVHWPQQSCHASSLAPPDLAEQQEHFRQLAPELDRVVQHAEHLASLCHQPTVTASELKAAQDELIAARQAVMPTAMASPAFGPITTALLRDLYDGRVLDTRTRADHQAQAYRTWKARMYEVMEQLQQTPATDTLEDCQGARYWDGQATDPLQGSTLRDHARVSKETVSGTVF